MRKTQSIQWVITVLNRRVGASSLRKLRAWYQGFQVKLKGLKKPSSKMRPHARERVQSRVNTSTSKSTRVSGKYYTNKRGKGPITSVGWWGREG